MIDANLSQIDAVLSDLERLERQTRGQFAEPSDAKKALEIVARIERKMIERASQSNRNATRETSAA